MEEWSFADILMILVVCGIIYAILALSNRSAREKQKNFEETGVDKTAQDTEESPEGN